MNVNITNENGQYTFKLGGMIDSMAAPDFQEAVTRVAGETYEKGGFNAVFDMADVTFISSAGLRVLLMARKTADRQNGTIAVTNVKQSIREVFDMTGFSKMLNIR
ncbi:MAG: STAS domain-containing protein [Synergistaceae bacterium]|jgi:anti-sigma B factor antagonist|nr:STAS domain-containing protein [Synergistaceae bacterium]